MFENTIDHPSIGVAFCIPEPSRQQICRVQNGPICTPIPFAPAGGLAVRGLVAVCLRRRGPCGWCVCEPALWGGRRIRRQGGGGQAFSCLHDGSPAGSAGSPGLQEYGAAVMLFFCRSKDTAAFCQVLTKNRRSVPANDVWVLLTWFNRPRAGLPGAVSLVLLSGGCQGVSFRGGELPIVICFVNTTRFERDAAIARQCEVFCTKYSIYFYSERRVTTQRQVAFL